MTGFDLFGAWRASSSYFLRFRFPASGLDALRRYDAPPQPPCFSLLGFRARPPTRPGLCYCGPAGRVSKRRRPEAMVSNLGFSSFATLWSCMTQLSPGRKGMPGRLYPPWPADSSSVQGLALPGRLGRPCIWSAAPSPV